MKKSTKILAIILICIVFIAAVTAVAFYVRYEIRDELDYGERVLNGSISESENNAKAENKSYIGEEKAKEIALSECGLNSEEVYFKKIELDNDDGIRIYEVEFRHGSTDYEFGIKADDGTVVSYDVDHND